MNKMREIELKCLDLQGTDQKFEYADLIIAIMQQPNDPKAGIGIKEMRNAMKVIDSVEAVGSGGKLLLTEEQWSVLNGKVESFPFARVLPQILEFADDIANAKSCDNKPVG